MSTLKRTSVIISIFKVQEAYNVSKINPLWGKKHDEDEVKNLIALKGKIPFMSDADVEMLF